MITGTSPSSFGRRPATRFGCAVGFGFAVCFGFAVSFVVAAGTAAGCPMRGFASPRVLVRALASSASDVYVTFGSHRMNSLIPLRRVAWICARTSASP
jgi:hypothetical protein